MSDRDAKTLEVLTINHQNLKEAQEARIKIQKELVALVQEATAILGQIHSLPDAEGKLKEIHEKEKKKLEEFTTAMNHELHKKSVWQHELAKALVHAVVKKKSEAETKALFNPETFPFLKEILSGTSVADVEEDSNMEHLLISWNEIEFIPNGEIGEGAFGKVARAKCKGVDAAVKILKSTDIAAQETFRRECLLLSKIPHENVLQFIAACAETDHYALVTEYAPNKSLADHVKPCAPGTTPQFSLVQKVQILQEIATGMQFLAQNKIIHLDLKPANILLDENWHVRIADFGMSKITGKKETDFANIMANQQVGGTPLYMAPELLPGTSSAPVPDEKCDVFSFGVLAWETFAQQEPYPKAVKANIASLAEAVRKGDRPNKYVDANEITKMTAVNELLKRCWDTNPSERNSFSALLEENNNPWRQILAEELSENSATTKQFWESCLADYKKNHGTTDAALWKAFLTKMDGEFSVSLQTHHHAALQTILEVDTEANPTIVTADQWNAFVQWFGPFERGTIVKKIDLLIDILAKPWFFGPMSATEAEYRLCFEPPGTFLVRYSATQKTKFSLSWVQQDKKTKSNIIRHYRLCEKAETLIQCVNSFETSFKKSAKHTPKACPERPAKYRLNEGKKSK